MSHHFDGPTAIQDGRLNLCDAYAFPGQPGNSVLILTVNPDAGRSSATTFRSESVYEFVIGRAADREDLCLRVLFSAPRATVARHYGCLLQQVTTSSIADWKPRSGAGVEHVLADAWHRGARTASLQLTRMGQRLYTELGFRAVGRYEEWICCDSLKLCRVTGR
jgi:hypothetical protein